MANFLSEAAQFNTPQAPYDLNLINQTLAIQQSQYDAGEKAYQDNLAQLKMQENLLIRPEDRARFANNVQGLIDEVNSKEGGIDWAKRGLTNKINSYTKQALDDYTINQIAISQNIKSFQSEIAEKKKKNDGSYSDVNYAYSQAQAGIGDYLRGVDANGNRVDNIGNLQYHNYVDVTKSALEKVKAFKDLRGDTTVEVPITDANGVMRMQKKSVNGLTEAELLAYVPQILSPEEGKQLQINGWAKFQGDGGLAVAQETFKNYTKEVNANLDENIKRLETEANNKNISQEQRDKAHADKITQEDLKKQYSASFSSINLNDAASIGGFLETVNWKTNFAKMAGAKTSINYDTDTAAYTAANLELAQKEELRKEAKFPYELEKLKQDAGLSTTTGIGAVGAGGVSLSTVESEKIEDTQPYVSLVKDFGQQSASIVAIGNATLAGGGVDDNTKKAYDDKYNEAIKRGYAPATATKIAFSESGMKNLFPEQYANIQEAYIRRGNTATVIKEANEQTQNTFRENPKKYLQTAENIANTFKNLNEQIKGSLTEDLRRTFPMFSTEKSDTEAMAKARTLSTFIQDNGGIKNLEQVLSNPKNTALLDKFTELIEGVKKADTFGGIFKPSYDSAVSESAKKRNETVVKRGQGIVNTAQIATVTNPKIAEQIINAIPQEEGKIPFNPKQGITYKALPSGEFEITQSGTKEGVQGLYGSSRKYIVKPTDDLYKVLNSLTLNEAQRREVTAGNYTTPINNENIQYLDSTKKTTVNKAATFVTNTLDINVQLPSKVHPTFFLTEANTNKAYREKLGNIIPEEKINILTQLMAKDTYNKFAVTATPVQGQWTTSVTLKKGGSPLLINETDTKKQTMDKQLLLYIKQYPQITIGEALLEYLQENPKEIDTIIQRLQ